MEGDRLDDLAIGPCVLEHRPEIAALVGYIVAAWSHAETLAARCFALIVGGETEEGFVRYHAIKRLPHRNKLLLAAAHGRLNVILEAEYRDLVARYEQLARERNALVHSAWAGEESGGRRLFLMPQVDVSRALTRMIYYRPPEAQNADHAFRGAQFREIKEEELRETLAQMQDIARRLSKLSMQALSLRITGNENAYLSGEKIELPSDLMP